MPRISCALIESATASINKENAKLFLRIIGREDNTQLHCFLFCSLVWLFLFNILSSLKRVALILCCLCVIILALVEWTYVQNDLPGFDTQQKVLSEHISARKAELITTAASFEDDACKSIDAYTKFPQKWDELYLDRGFFFTGYSSEKVFFWTNNSFPVSEEQVRERSENTLWKLKNGWYIAHRDTFGPCVVLGLALVRAEYSYQNDYLNNSYPFLKDFPAEANLSADSIEGALPIQLQTKEAVAWLIPAKDELGISNSSSFVSLLLAIAFLFLTFSVYLASVIFLNQKSTFGLILIWLLVVGLRLLLFFTHFPSSIYSLTIFNPSEYAASNWLPTLGDLFLNSLLLVLTAFLLYPFIKRTTARYKGNNIIIPALASGLWFMLALLVSESIEGLIINSSISLDIRDVLSLTVSSYFSFLIIGLLFGSLFVFLHAIISALSDSGCGYKRFLAILSIAILPAIAYSALYQLFVPFFFFLAIIVLCFVALKGKEQMTYSFLIALVSVFAALATYLILQHSSQREKDRRKLLAVKISAERDPIAESLFLETEQKLLTDTLLKSYLKPGPLPVGQVRDLAQLYFNGYWEKYSITVNVFGADECPMTALYTTTVKDPLTFDRLIDSVGMFTLSERFFFLDNGSGRISYMARLPIFNREGDVFPLGTLYIEFQSRYTPEEIGYPELLLDKMVKTRTDLSTYSYARYNRGRLVSHYGDFPYELTDLLFEKDNPEEFEFKETGEFNHLIYRPAPGSLVVLSKPLQGVLQMLTHFSYLVLFFSFLALIPLGANKLLRDRRLGPISFKRRVQLSIVLLLFLSLILIGGGTIVYIISNSNQKNISNISEKIHSLLIETEYILGKQTELVQSNADDLAYALTRQANVFFSDINIYDTDGNLYASSRSKIFEEGLISKKINPEAFYFLSARRSSEYIHQETIGDLQYASAYVPLRNFENKVIAYLNLPYFARQDELRKEIATFVVAIVNIYVLLLVLVVITAIFLSNTVTAPLKLIREKLSQIRLGKKNEIIEWRGNDEIADLVAEYNRMVNELTESADKLARSERETAWREMAKQVAHEIKNPLTPMKLSTQMLKRAWDDKAEGFDKRLDRYTQNLIEQIDTLSHIATEFSNFAKMPKMKSERVDLQALLTSAVEFHQGEGGVKINFEKELFFPTNVNTDKEQMLRVFNNLLRNAIQAIPEDREGEIQIRLQQLGKNYLLSITDNGSGIPEELKDRIFSPSFTTKNAGMGLGLALVKNIVENSQGKVWFESAEDLGTTFFIELPVFTES
jgi:two-component system, NtrC family, nitrogen regulation sensor histidine kinase NtrY